ncbi:hypothetical protein [Pseudomonas sp. NA-150]|uniref:hypothetical protein n=1 Tax=Pseudomonas sp. NA-150 TaxID=3367525 RepID=UPI0037C72C1E
MNIKDFSVQPNLLSPSVRESASPKPELSSTANAQKSGLLSSSVSISGQALLRQRLWLTNDPNYRLPRVANVTPGVLNSSPMVNFLTVGDRQLLGKVYEFAQEQGADLGYVDSLGFDLADYREHDNGRYMAPHNKGTAFDVEGHMMFYSFTDKDAATAKRILASEALKTTELDHGFIRLSLDKDYGPMRYSDFEFMEQVINRFSAKGAEVPPLGAKFEKHEYIENNFINTRSKEKYDLTGDTPVLLKNKTNGKLKNIRQPATIPSQPETLKQALRRIVTDYLRYSMGRVSSLADFLMRSGR